MSAEYTTGAGSSQNVGGMHGGVIVMSISWLVQYVAVSGYVSS